VGVALSAYGDDRGRFVLRDGLRRPAHRAARADGQHVLKRVAPLVAGPWIVIHPGKC
jgi:hypothetical protein